MRLARFAPALLVIPAVQLAGCTDSGVTTPADAPPPTFAHANAPPTSGPRVQRGVPLSVGIGVVETGLAMVAGFATPLTHENCQSPQFSSIPIPQQQVSTASGREQFTTSKQDVEVFVFRLEGGLTDICQVVDAPLVATGFASFTWGEKNVPPPGELGPGAGIVRLNTHGVLNLVGGGQARLFARFYLHFDPEGNLVTDTEIVRLTPL
jgi:hypothetical protein